MKFCRGLFNFWFSAAVLLLTMFSAIAEAATVSGTVTNTSGIPGRVYIGLKPSNWGDRVPYGVSVLPAGATPTSFAIKGIPVDSNNSYTLTAFVDSTGTGHFHANDPRATSSSVLVTGNINVGTLTLTAPGLTLPPVNLSPPEVMPFQGGALLYIRADRDNVTGGIYADAFNLSCNGGAIVRTNIPAPTMDDEGSLILLSGLTDGASLSCAVTPVVKGSPRPTLTSTDSTPVTIGNCTTAGNCSPAGVTVSGRVNLSGFASLAGKTLLVILSDWGNGPPGGIMAINNPSMTQSYSIPGVIPNARAYRTEFVLIDTDPGIWGIGADFLNERNEQARVIVEGGGDVIAPDVTIKKRNAFASVNVQRGFNSGNGYWTNLDFNLGANEKLPLNITLSNNTGTSLPAEGISATGYDSIRVAAKDSDGPGSSFNVNFEYADGSETVLVEIVKGVMEARVSQAFPVGQVKLNDLSKPVAGWRYSPLLPPLPGTVATAINGNNIDDWQENFTIATNWLKHELSAPLSIGTSYSVESEYEDFLGDSIKVWSSFTPVASGPVITSFTPSTGGNSTQVIISGSGFTGATSVTFNGISNAFTVNSDSQITTTVPTGAARGPLTVTSGGISGASATSFEKTATITGTVTNSSGSSNLSGIIVSTIGAGTPLSTTSAVNGTYSLTVPAGIPIYLKFHDPTGTYRDIYSRFVAYTGPSPNNNYSLFSATDFSAWEAIDPSFTAVKNGTAGMMRSRVTRSDAAATPIAGAKLIVRSKNYPKGNPAYKVIYADASTQPAPALTSTSSSGRYFVTGIEQGDTVVVMAEMAGYGFTDNVCQVYNGTICASRINGEPMPNVTLSPAGGNLNYGTYGVLVTVSLDQPGSLLYTTDGSDPQYFGSSAGNGGVISLPNAGFVTVKYIAKNASNVFGEPFSASYTVINDITPPTVYANPPGKQVYSASYGFSKTLPISVTFTANEPATIWYTTNGTDPSTSPGRASLSVVTAGGSTTAVNVNDGTVVKFYALDGGGNSSGPQTVTMVQDADPPTISNAYYYGYNGTSNYNSSIVAYGINATDISLSYGGSLWYLVTATNISPTLNDPAWNNSSYWQETVQSEGTYTRYAWVKDLAGNISPSTTITFRVDMTPPAKPVITPFPYSRVNTNYPILSGTAEANSSIMIDCDNGLYQFSAVTDGAGAWTATNYNYLADGSTHTVRARATDTAGNAGLFSVTYTFMVDLAGSVKVDGDATTYYAINPALDAITTEGQTAKARDQVFTENVIMTSPATIVLKGGYFDTGFTSQPSGSYTTIDGSTKIRSGTLKVDRLKIK